MEDEKPKRTENQNRAWLETKLKGYLWKIKGENSYGSRKKQVTIFIDLAKILKEFEENI